MLYCVTYITYYDIALSYSLMLYYMISYHVILLFGAAWGNHGSSMCAAALRSAWRLRLNRDSQEGTKG